LILELRSIGSSCNFNTDVKRKERSLLILLHIVLLVSLETSSLRDDIICNVM